MYRDRIRMPSLESKIISPQAAAAMISDGMTIGMSGFTKSGDAKVVAPALAERAQHEKIKITLLTGASVSDEIDSTLTKAGVLARRMPYQGDPTLRKAINAGEVMYVDQHLSETVEMLRSNQINGIDIAIIDATAITENGGIVPTTSVGNSASFAILAKKIIIELNVAQPLGLEGLHDIYIPTHRPTREPVPVVSPDSRVGTTYIPIDPSKIAGIVIADKRDNPVKLEAPDADTKAIASHLIEFLKHEVKVGRLTNRLAPLQSGVGAIANAVLHGFADCPFHDLTMYSEVIQDSVFDLIDTGKLVFASATAYSLTQSCWDRFYANFETYKKHMVLRPQEISNHPEVIRRLGLIAINTALEADIYGNVNSTHVGGTHMMNGIGGSGDFAGNAYLTTFVTKSIAKNGAISSIVPMVTHVDHPEHDVDLLITEQGLADLRGLAPRERAKVVIDNCVHPDFKDALRDYYKEALKRGGQTPHVLEKAFSWHTAFRETGDMKKAF
ncbi:acetyl-CoA hydrolase/transferase family protein [Telmatospirillum sp.]|uniref:acetyl-CoA hydrolase/transferase family protein n=1 Tax=Telmatospirillum sp. TaxID=2079197 RepID=UPI00284CC6CC|nr:acetyl-CoA hydrolase/transferase family protein [Telmatospirillum sp.]MDR3437058.1 acetyl-CoA hydrolase/transferase family protein [Telmatospirillum sp.]